VRRSPTEVGRVDGRTGTKEAPRKAPESLTRGRRTGCRASRERIRSGRAWSPRPGRWATIPCATAGPNPRPDRL